MKLSFSSIKSKSKEKQTILFVCIQNAGRSQMTEAFFRKYAPDDYEPLSAGTKPTSEVNPIAIEAMKEVDIDISKEAQGYYRGHDEKFVKDSQHGMYGKGLVSNYVCS